MTDIASLGIAIDSNPLRKLAVELNNVKDGAKGAEDATKKMSSQVDKSTSIFAAAKNALLGQSNANNVHGASLEKLGEAYKGIKGDIASFIPAASAGGSALVSLAPGFLKLAAVVVAAVANFKAFVSETSAAEEVQADLQATLKSTGSISGQTIDHLNDMSKAMQNVSTYSDEAVGAGQGVLLMFTNIRGEAFDKATAAAVDLAAKMKTDIPSAARLIGRALEDPIQGLTMLRRAGVILSDSQKEQVKQFAALNDVARVNTIILDAVSKSTAGAAAAQRATLGGTLEALKNAWGDLFELAPRVSKIWKDAINNLITAIQNPTFVNFAQTIGEDMFQVAAKVTNGFAKAINTISYLVNSIDVLKTSILGATYAQAGLTDEQRSAQNAAVSLTDRLIELGKAIISPGGGGATAEKGSVAWLLDKSGDLLQMIPGLKQLADATNDVVNPKNQDPVGNVIQGTVKELNGIASASAAASAAVMEMARSVPGAFDILRRGALTWFRKTPPEIEDATSTTWEKLGENIANKTISAFFNNWFTQAQTQAAIAVMKKAAMQINTEQMLKPMEFQNAPGLGGVFPQTLQAPVGYNKHEGAGGGQKEDPYAKITQDAQNRIKLLEAEAKGYGMTKQAAAAYKAEQEMLNKAASDHLVLLPKQTAELRALAEQEAAAAASKDKAKFLQEDKESSDAMIRQLQMEQDVMYMGVTSADAYRMAFERLEKARRAQITLTPEEIAAINASAAAMAQTKTKLNDQKQIMETGRQVFTGFFQDIRTGLTQGQTLWDSFGNAALNALNRIAEKLISMAAEKLWDAAFPGGGGGGGGGGLIGLIGGLIGGGGAAAGVGGASGFIDALAAGGSGVLFAEGGRPPVGQPYIVGENGPEVRIDDRPGTIMNADQWGSGGGGVTIHQSNYFGADVSKPVMAAWAQQIKKESIEGANKVMLDNRRRGGKSKQIFRGQ